MPSINAIKQRRGVVMNMKQAMKAMNLVSTAKLRKARERWGNTLPFLEGVDKIMLDAAKSPLTAENIFVRRRDTLHKNAGYIVIASDRGKCGSYNINICKAVIEHAGTRGSNALILPVGSRGLDYFLSQSMNIHRVLGGMPEAPSYEDAEAIGRQILADFCTDNKAFGELDEIYIAFTKYRTVLNLEPVIVPVLPISLRFGNEPGISIKTNTKTNTETSIETSTKGFFPDAEPSEMEYDPDVDSFLGYMAPMYLNVQIYGAMLESALCEQAARMVATDTATNNADELIESLTLLYNRQRQGIITQEITEIVSGASALT